MNRKEFLKTFLKAGFGLGCCGAGIGHSLLAGSASTQGTDQGWINEYEKKMAESTKTPPWRIADKAQIWIKDIVANIDAILDDETRIKLLHSNGRSCYTNAFGVASKEGPSPQQAARFMKYLEDGGYKIQREENITTVIYNWGGEHQNPYGMYLEGGNCLCPAVENISSGLSPTFCQCSAGYVAEIFRRQLGKPVKGDVLDSLKMGGKDCIFKLEITES